MFTNTDYIRYGIGISNAITNFCANNGLDTNLDWISGSPHGLFLCGFITEDEECDVSVRVTFDLSKHEYLEGGRIDFVRDDMLVFPRFEPECKSVEFHGCSSLYNFLTRASMEDIRRIGEELLGCKLIDC